MEPPGSALGAYRMATVGLGMRMGKITWELSYHGRGHQNRSLTVAAPTGTPPFITKSTFCQRADIFERIAGDRDDVGQVARLERADPPFPAEQLRAV
jgi:hypothetical protein